MKDIIKKLKEFAVESNKDLYIVGGYIRDKLMNSKRQPEDIDIVYEGDIKEIIDCMGLNSYGIYPLKAEMGIYRAVIMGKVVDISNLKGKNIEEDLSKRDFTVNAIALNLKNNLIIDPFEGRRHLANRVLKEVTKESISNDRVRILRGIKMIIKSGMHFSAETENTVRIESSYLKECTKERVFSEFMKIISCDEFGEAFSVLDSYGVLKELIPYVEEHKAIGRCKYHVEDAFTHMNASYKAFKELIRGDIKLDGLDLSILDRRVGEFNLQNYIAFGIFNHDIGKYSCYRKESGKVSFLNHEKVGAKIINEFCDFWRFPKEGTRIITKLVQGHMYPLGLFKSNLKDYKKSFYKFFKKYEYVIPYILITSFCDMYATTIFINTYNEWEVYKKFLEKLFKEYEIYITVKGNPIIHGDELKKIFNLKHREIGEALSLVEEMNYRELIESKEEAVNFLSKRCIINENM
ncbi:CCA tRNA nucleotidyltransferase [Clostridium sp. KNHs214]|uniref:CCA tRNA nucleotidyltransferase n=1 Tax=Clostridium sp. KNHs214 TaxID=1540257 RepID=UPI0005531ADF|nr:CCA tRNA nucleotidyltransferase [Clostridium sp. KNHs214]